MAAILDFGIVFLFTWIPICCVWFVFMETAEVCSEQLNEAICVYGKAETIKTCWQLWAKLWASCFIIYVRSWRTISSSWFFREAQPATRFWQFSISALQQSESKESWDRREALAPRLAETNTPGAMKRRWRLLLPFPAFHPAPFLWLTDKRLAQRSCPIARSAFRSETCRACPNICSVTCPQTHSRDRGSWGGSGVCVWGPPVSATQTHVPGLAMSPATRLPQAALHLLLLKWTQQYWLAGSMWWLEMICMTFFLSFLISLLPPISCYAVPMLMLLPKLLQPDHMLG